jgi:DNA polymerase I-like protein with 3'-5' exonuclease and polymerase domains
LAEVEAFDAKQFAFDFEWDMWTGEVTLCGLSDRLYHAIVVPFEGEYVRILRRIFENAEVLIGHNIVGADLPYIYKWGWDISKARIEDTMLKQHLIQPDMRHGLNFVASVFTNRVFWKGQGEEEEDEPGSKEYLQGAQWKTWDKTGAIPRSLGGYGGCTSGIEAYRLYNARDTSAEFEVNLPIDTTLDKAGMRDVYELVSLPLGIVCQRLGEKGLKIDKTKLVDVQASLDKTIEELDAKLPEGLKSAVVPVVRQVEAPFGTLKPKVKVCRGRGKNKHEEWKVTFTEEGQEAACPECGKAWVAGHLERAKTIRVHDFDRVYPWRSAPQLWDYAQSVGCEERFDRKTGQPTTGKHARKFWLREHPEFITVDELKAATTLRSTFAKPGLLKTDRMFFNLLVHGTGEGRLSSTGKRKGIDLNVQNIPEEMKVLFVPDEPDWCFLDLDISQGENLLRAWFCEDWEKIEAIKSGECDEHSETATAFFGIPVTKTNENKHLRKAGKVANHALGYGGGWKTIMEDLAGSGFAFSAAEVKEMLANWRANNPKVVAWQNRTIALAKQQGYLTNPFGRKRWFQVRDIGPKALAFVPASTLADCVLRMMVGMHRDLRVAGVDFNGIIERLGLERSMKFTEPWRMSIQVHDSLVAQGPKSGWTKTFEEMNWVMRMPFKELGGFSFNVDGKVCMDNLGKGEKVKQ